MSLIHLGNFYNGLRISFRARYFYLVFLSLLVVVLVALLSAQFSARQPAIVAMDVGLSVIRLIFPVAIVLIVQELFYKEFDRRYYLNTLSYPCSRHRMLLERFLIVILLAFFLLFILSVVLWFLVCYLASYYFQGAQTLHGGYYAVVILFISIDVLVVCALAIFLSMLATSYNFVLIGVVGFVLISRSFSVIINLLANDASLVGEAEGYREGLGLIAYLLPDLASLDVRMISLYGRLEFLPVKWYFSLSSCLLYVLAVMAASVFLFNKKHFS